MTKTIEERLEEQEEVLQLMLTKLQTLENRKVEFPDIRIPNYSSQLEILKKELLRVNHSYPVEKIDEQISRMKNLSKSLPELIKVKRYHHFEDKSKGFIIGAMVLLIVSALAIGMAISMWKENGRLNENSVKFRIIRQGYPNVAHWADTIYHRDPLEMKEFVEKIEAERLATERAEIAAREKVQSAKQRLRELRQLQGKLKVNN